MKKKRSLRKRLDSTKAVTPMHLLSIIAADVCQRKGELEIGWGDFPSRKQGLIHRGTLQRTDVFCGSGQQFAVSVRDVAI